MDLGVKVNNKFIKAYNVLLVAKKKKKAWEVNVLEEEQYEIIGTKRAE